MRPTNFKICRNYSLTPLKKLNESADAQANNGKYVFQGVFTACSTPEKVIVNRNNRIYTKTEILKHLAYLREAIKTQGCLLGELDHPDGRFDIQLKEASHKIVDLWYDNSTDCVMGKIELLDTPNGKIAKEIIDAGYPLYVSSRAAGDVDEATKEVQIAQIFTYDIVCTPGFEEAKLDRVYESLSGAACKYLNESVGSHNNKKRTVFLVTECEDEFKPNKKATRLMNTPINMKDLCRPINEEEEKDKNEFTLPEPELNPQKVDDEDEKKDGDKVVKDESPKNPQKIDKKDDISEDDDDAKEEKKKAILGITAEDKDGNIINTDNETKDESEVADNRSKILKVYGEEAKDDEPAETKDENKEDEADNDEATEAEIEECNTIKSKLTKETDELCAELDAVLDQVTKTEAVKESIIRRYPFSISLSESEFAKFAALRPNQKLKCAEFIEEHQIFDIQAINELWCTPLKTAKKVQQNWLKLASRRDIDLYTRAPKEVQDAIEESAKYVILETQEDVDDFWARTGLRQEEARKMMAEQFVQKYKTPGASPYDQSVMESNNPLGYSYDFIQMLEDFYDKN